jgi:RNA polymerase sigma-70 factor (ECF subfamily)
MIRTGPPPAAPPPSETTVLLTAALRKLPSQLRHTVVLHYLFDMSVADIAAETGSPVGTVTSWLSRARVELAAILSAPATPAPKVLLEANDVE